MTKTKDFYPDCPHCHRVANSTKNADAIIFQSEASIAVMGDHSFYPGYAMLISKVHVREIFALESALANQLFLDLRKLAKAISEEFSPHKLNIASLGNVDEHLHWHIFPRYLSDESHKKNPWFHEPMFNQFLLTEQKKISDSQRLRSRMK